MISRKEFKINEYITLKLEEGSTDIYIAGELFDQCKVLLLNIPITEVKSFEEIDSIDKVADVLGWNGDEQEGDIDTSTITPETEFWAHCSNLQTWAEHGYDTRLLHSNLSFPLLKKLVDVGDPTARRVFKDEIAERFMSNYPPVVEYLLTEKYFEYLNEEEFSSVIRDSEIIEMFFKYGYIGYNELLEALKTFHQKASAGLRDKIFDEDNRLRKWVVELSEDFSTIRYQNLEILYQFYNGNRELKMGFVNGLGVLFKEGSFSLIYSILEYKRPNYLEDIIEDLWDEEFFTRDTPVIQYILTCLEEEKTLSKYPCIEVLRIIWRFMEGGLSDEMIKLILKDKENKIDLLLRLTTVWYFGTEVLSYDTIPQIQKIGAYAIEELKNQLKGKENKSGYPTRGKLNSLSFRTELEDHWYDFQHTLEIVYELFGAEELINYLESWENIPYLIQVNKDNYPGPYRWIANALVECSEGADSSLATSAKNIYDMLDDNWQEWITQYYNYP